MATDPAPRVELTQAQIDQAFQAARDVLALPPDVLDDLDEDSATAVLCARVLLETAAERDALKAQATAITGPGIASAAGFRAPDQSTGTPDLGRRLDEQANQREHIMQFFVYEHLPIHLREVSVRFAALADWVVANLTRNPERSVALRHLMDGKDAAVRARVAK